MKRVLAKLSRLASTLIWTPKPVRRRPIERVRLGIEVLETRELLATLLYVGPENGEWSAQANWRNFDNQQQWVPGINDILIFDPTQSVGGIQGTDTNSIANIVNLTLADLTVRLGGTKIKRSVKTYPRPH